MRKLVSLAILLQFIFLSCVNSEPLEYKVYYEDGKVDNYYFQKPPQSVAFMSIGFVRYIDHIEVISGADQVEALFFEISEGPNKKRIFLHDFNMFSNIEYLWNTNFIFTDDDLSALYTFKKIRVMVFAPKSMSMEILDLKPLKYLETISLYFPKNWLKVDSQLLLPKSLKYVLLEDYPVRAIHIIDALKKIDKVVIFNKKPNDMESKNYPSNFQWLSDMYNKNEKSPVTKMFPEFPDITNGIVLQERE